MVALFSLIAIGSVWFWLLIALAVIIGMACLEREEVGGLVGLTVVTALIFGLLSPIKDSFAWVWANPLQVLAYIGGYFLLGFAYSFLKWDRFIAAIKRDYEETKEKWLQDKGIVGEVVPESLKVEWSVYVKDMYNSRISDFAFKRITYLKYKAIIVAWIIWWPLSLMWLVINDPVKRMAEYLVFKFRTVYNAIVNRHRGSLDSEMVTDVETLRREEQRTGERAYRQK